MGLAVQRPGETVSNPGGHQQPLGRMRTIDVNVDLNDVGESIPTMRGSKTMARVFRQLRSRSQLRSFTA